MFMMYNNSLRIGWASYETCSLVFAVQDIALYASNGGYYSVCPVHVSICFRDTRVLLFLSFQPCPLSQFHPMNKCIYKKVLAFSFSCINYAGDCDTYLSTNATFPLHFWSKNVSISFARRTDVMPPVPLETKHHPSAVDLLLIKRLIAETSKPHLLQFLQHEFVNIGKAHAERLIGINHHHTLVW